MKIRNGFVSNSSSASFLVIDASRGHETLDYDQLQVQGNGLVFGRRGEREFGWGPEDITDVHSRINFAYLQSLYLDARLSKSPMEQVLDMAEGKPRTHAEMIERVIAKHIGDPDVPIRWELCIDDWDSPGHGYIDHQSSAVEGENTEIFDSEEALKDFLFGMDSRIHLDNDNH